MTTDTFLSALLDSPLQEQKSLPQISDKDANEIRAALLRQISYSALNELNLCERKYYLTKLTVGNRDSTISTAFGRAVGAGVQTLWRSGGDLKAAKFACFTNFDSEFGDTKDRSKQSIAFALKALEKYLPFYELLSQEWELAIIDGVPAVEYSLLIELPSGFVYRSYVDLILKHKQTSVFCIKELKIDGSTWIHEAKYKNSDQGLSYSLILDHVAPGQSFYWVKYLVFYSTMQEWIPYDFPKGLLEKARWIKTTLRDTERIKTCEKEDYWPMRGQSCMAFGAPCKFFDTCQLQDKALISSPAILQNKLEEEKARVYLFRIPLKQIIENYLSGEEA